MKTLILVLLINHPNGQQDVAMRYELPAPQCLSMQAAIWESNPGTMVWAGETDLVSPVDAMCEPVNN